MADAPMSYNGPSSTSQSTFGSSLCLAFFMFHFLCFPVVITYPWKTRSYLSVTAALPLSNPCTCQVNASSIESAFLDPGTPQRYALVVVGAIRGTLISAYNPASPKVTAPPPLK